MTRTCGCCIGIHVSTPATIENRPGLTALSYRAGTHAAFLESMKARLSTGEFPPLESRMPSDPASPLLPSPLAGLRTRDPSDPALALLDAWASVGDVLTFYQERLANEGYLRTATERRSILELARLVGYTPRPGVSASVFLAYTLEKGYAVQIPAGARSQSIPGPGELPQSFETVDPLEARAEWNNLVPRQTQPQNITLEDDVVSDDGVPVDRLYLEGLSTGLRQGDRLLLVFGDRADQKVVMRVEGIVAQFNANRTEVRLQPDSTGSSSVESARASLAPESADGSGNPEQLASLARLRAPLLKPPAVTPSSSAKLGRELSQSLRGQSDTRLRMLASFRPGLADTLYQAWGNADVNGTSTSLLGVYALRVQAPLFGYNAPKQVEYVRKPDPSGSVNEVQTPKVLPDPCPAQLEEAGEADSLLMLDTAYDQVLPGPESYVLVYSNYEAPDNNEAPDGFRLFTVSAAETRARTAYGLSGKTTALTVSGNWWPPEPPEPPDPDCQNACHEACGAASNAACNAACAQASKTFKTIRQTMVYTQSEKLPLAEEPVTKEVEGSEIELDRLYAGLESGRWAIVSGERTDVDGTHGVQGAELVMLAGVRQTFDKSLPGDKVHTTLVLSSPLAYRYKRETVTIYGNVAKATQGETRTEVMGSGDARQVFQRFTLRQPPLTWLPAPTRDGVVTTLEVRVNDVRWHEAEGLVDLKRDEHGFITRTDDERRTTVVFGDGQQGARVPTGVENVTAVYRNGIGKSGNVKARQISLLTTRPLGVKEVINPLRASGGADRETRDQARRSTPLAALTLDRLVSIQDYASFAQTFAGIGKASAVQLSDGHRRWVQVTIAGAEDIPIDPSSELFRNLREALHRYGDPALPIQLDVRELLLLIVSARVRLLPDYRWDSMQAAIRAKLLDTFSFEARELAQGIAQSEVISAIQAVRGVSYVDLDVLQYMTEEEAVKTEEEAVKTEEEAVKTEEDNTAEIPSTLDNYVISLPARTGEQGIILPAQLLYLSPDVTDTLILKELTI